MILLVSNWGRWLAPALGLGLVLLFQTPVWAVDCLSARSLYQRAQKISDFDERRSLLREAVRLCPSDARAWNNLADAEENLGHLDEAVAGYRKALECDPGLAIAHFGLADIFFKQGRCWEACQAYVHGLKIDPNDHRAREGLREAESCLQAAGWVLAPEYIKDRLKYLGLMAPAGVRLRMAFQNITFNTNEDDPKPESLEQLRAIGQALKEILTESGKAFSIAGHTDNLGTPAYNLDLSRRRAAKVKSYLVEKFNIDPAKLETEGFGLTKPVVDNSTSENRARNRRVEIGVRE